MLRTVYIETTIPSFYYNQRSQPEMIARMNWTREWWDQHRVAYDVFSSTVVVDELRRTVHPRREEKIALLNAVTLLEPTSEIEEIVEVYLERKLMPNDPAGDALHLALASFHRCDILLTWNCAHLANVNKFDQIRRVNALLGLHVPILTTPLEILESRDDDES